MYNKVNFSYLWIKLQYFNIQINLKVKGLDIPPLDSSFPQRQPVISDASLEDANRIIFSPWDAISGYEEPVTDIIDIPGDFEGVLTSNTHKKFESTTRIAPRLEQIASKNISIEEDKSNKSSSFSQLVIRVQTSHFHKVCKKYFIFLCFI